MQAQVKEVKEMPKETESDNDEGVMVHVGKSD
jgi:hypothetical protein